MFAVVLGFKKNFDGWIKGEKITQALRFALSWLDRVTTWMETFLLVIANVVPVAEEVTQSVLKVRSKLISQLISGISPKIT